MDFTWIIIGVAVIGVVAFSLLSAGGIESRARRAIKTRELDDVVDYIRGKSGEDKATAFNKAVKLMWDGYERALAAALVRRLAPEMGDVRIVQYWLKQVLEIEPEIATESFDDEFVDQCYRPDVARKCGSFG